MNLFEHLMQENKKQSKAEKKKTAARETEACKDSDKKAVKEAITRDNYKIYRIYLDIATDGEKPEIGPESQFVSALHQAAEDAGYILMNDSYSFDFEDVTDAYPIDDLGDWMFDESCHKESKKVVKEEFSPTFPAWVKGALEPGKKGYYDKRKQPNALAKGLLGKNIDLNSATFIETEPPASNRDPILRDTTKIPIFLLDLRGDGGSRTTYYSPVSDAYSEILVPSPSGRGYEYQDLSKTPWKTILARTLKFGYFDLNDPENSMADVRKDRAELRKKGVNRGVGQHKYTSYDGTTGWYMTRGEDKSGYKVDPYKYKKMLDTLNEDNYAKMLENTGNRINAMVDKVLALGQDPKYRTRDALRYFERAFSYLADARYEYEKIQESIDRYFNNPDYQQNYGTLGDYLKYAYTGSISTVRDYLRRIDEIIKNITTEAEQV